MPNRYVRASAIESEAVNALSPSAEVFYRRLINRADDFGRYTANPAILRASLFPLQLDRISEKAIASMLGDCINTGLVFVYEAGGKKLLVMNKWEQGRAKQSEYAEPPPDICEQMKTYVYGCKHMHPTPTPTPTPTPITDTDKGAPVASLPFGSDAFAAAWTDFCQHRRELKKKLTPTATRQIFADLAAWGEQRAIAAIRHTIGKGWQGIREPDQRQSQTAKPLEPCFDKF